MGQDTPASLKLFSLSGKVKESAYDLATDLGIYACGDICL